MAGLQTAIRAHNYKFIVKLLPQRESVNGCSYQLVTQGLTIFFSENSKSDTFRVTRIKP